MPNPTPPSISLARLAELAQKVNASQHPDYVCCIHERFGENQCCGVHQNLVDATRKSAPALLTALERLAGEWDLLAARNEILHGFEPTVRAEICRGHAAELRALIRGEGEVKP